jgi:hypothetical protein
MLEQHEVEHLRSEVAGREREVAQLEAEIQELEGEIDEFRQRYDRAVGFAAARVVAARELLAQLEAEQYAAKAKTPPRGVPVYTMPSVEEQYRQRWGNRAQHTEYPEPPETLPELSPDVDDATKPNLKKLYRALARTYHPDFASDEEDRDRRTQLMTLINDAYQKGDLSTLQLLQRVKPDDGEGDTQTPFAMLVLQQLRNVASALGLQVATLQNRRNRLINSEWMKLKLDEKLLKAQGRDLMKETLQGFDVEYAQLQRRIDRLRSER